MYNSAYDVRFLSPFVTICHHLSPFVTICHHLSPFVTICHHLSPFVTCTPFVVTVEWCPECKSKYVVHLRLGQMFTTKHGRSVVSNSNYKLYLNTLQAPSTVIHLKTSNYRPARSAISHKTSCTQQHLLFTLY